MNVILRNVVIMGSFQQWLSTSLLIEVKCKQMIVNMIMILASVCPVIVLCSGDYTMSTWYLLFGKLSTFSSSDSVGQPQNEHTLYE